MISTQHMLWMGCTNTWMTCWLLSLTTVERSSTLAKLFLTTVQMYIRVAMVTDHLEAPKIGAGRARRGIIVCICSDLGLAVPAVVVMNSHEYPKNKASILTQMMPQFFQVHFRSRLRDGDPVPDVECTLGEGGGR